VRARAADIDGFHKSGESLPTNLLIYAALQLRRKDSRR
jgi:hypothetical protein